MIEYNTRKNEPPSSRGAVWSSNYSKAIRTGLITVALAGVWGSSVAIADNKGINRLAIRNCSPAKMLICVYDKKDNVLAIPYHAKRVKPGEKERFSCGSANRCKVFMGTDHSGMQRLLDKQKNQILVWAGAGAAGSVALTVGVGGYATMAIIGATGAGLAGALAISTAAGVVAAGAAVGSVVAVVKTIDGLNLGKICKHMMNDQRKAISKIDDKKLRNMARAGFKDKVSGRFPKYKNHSLTVRDNGILKLESGDKC